jgi:hypothetical protein
VKCRDLFGEQAGVTARGEPDDLEAFGMARDHVQRLRADAAGRTENRDPFAFHFAPIVRYEPLIPCGIAPST